MSDLLEQYKQNSDALISEKAITVETLMAQYNTGELTLDEYNELVNDLLDLDKITKLSNNVRNEIMYKQAFEALFNIAKAII